MPGLRRGEVAALAGVSIEYYSKLERGSLAGVSASVLDAIARALRLDDAERSHLFNLAQAADGTSQLLRPTRRSRKQWTPRPEPDLGPGLHHRRAGHRPQRTHGPARHQPARPCHARLALRTLTRAGAELRPLHLPRRGLAPVLPRLGHRRRHRVAILRTEAGRDPHDPLMHDLVGELATRSEEFRRRWASHDVRLHGAGTKTFHHTAVGDLELAYESVDMVSDPGLTLTIYAAEPASRTAEALALLGSLTAPDMHRLHDVRES